MSELFVENDSVSEEPVKKPRKKREPMSAEKKLEFAARMKASREAKKLEKEQAKEQAKLAKEASAPAPKEVQKVVKPKKDRVLRHVPNELDIHKHEIDCLKNELLLLKKNKTTNKKDMEEIRELKLEMKELRDAARLYKQSLKKKETPPAPLKENIKLEIKEPPVKAVEPQAKAVTTAQAKPIDIPKPKAKYSTYKKSIWAQFT